MNRSVYIRLMLILSALLHLVTAPERFTNASHALGYFYILLGVFQIILVFGLSFSNNKIWLSLIYLSCAGLFVLFVVNQTLAGIVPFLKTEPYSYATLFRKIFEMNAGVSAYYLYKRMLLTKTHTISG